jgi:hypothetical protein
LFRIQVPEEKDEAAVSDLFVLLVMLCCLPVSSEVDIGCFGLQEGTLEEETLASSEPELPLKRLRRGQDGQVSGSPSDIEAGLGGSPFKKSKVEGKGLAGETSEQQSSDMRISQPKPIAIWSPNRNTSSQTVSPRRLAVLEHSKQRSNE